jgi:hypothetical protein
MKDIKMIETTYQGGEVTDINEEYINIQTYESIINAIPFFEALGGTEIAEKQMTEKGYKVTKLISIRADKKKKVVREFTFI